MNLLSVSGAGAAIFAAYLLVVMYLARLIIAKFPDSTAARGLAAILL